LRFLPLGETYTLYFAAPILPTATAALFMGERVGPRRWAAVLVGFMGVLVVMGLPTQWQLASILALGAAALSVARDVCTRKISPAVGSGTVGAATALIVGLGGATTAVGGGWVALTAADIAFCALAALGAAGGYVGFVAALRLGDLSFVATFRYAGIPVAVLLGLLVWGDVPGPQMLGGAVLIVGSGVYIVLRERRLMRAAAAQDGPAALKGTG
jgi:drug/metabolite transporter (DMT)-like permease